MATPKCGARHPQHEDWLCVGPADTTHDPHFDRAGHLWEHEGAAQRAAALRPTRKGRDKSKSRRGMAEVAAAIISSRRAGEPSGIPEEARAKWTKDAWVIHAEGVFRDFLKTRVGPFTTAEDVWPLLDAPEEMRAMSVVTQRMLKAQFMHEAGATRLRGTYRTRDGVEFQENKLVPVYESLIVIRPTDHVDAVR